MVKSAPKILKDIFIYPIKSLGGISIKSSPTRERGLPYDRRWLLVNKDNSFLTQRKLSEMALLKVSLADDGLEVKHINNTLPILKIPFNHHNQEKIPVTIFDDLVEAPIIKDRHIEEWFRNALDEEVKLVFMDASTKRPVDPNFVENGEEVSFADGYPFLITNQASLDDLNSRLEEPLPMNRFRPNFVVAGAQSFEEDNWKLISMGDAVFKAVKPCSRCKITTINQNTGERGQEPLNTLSSYRKFNNKIIFGQNLILIKPGKINVGDEVKIEYK